MNRTIHSIVARAHQLEVKKSNVLFCAETNSYYESPTKFAEEFHIKSVGMVCCAALGTRETIKGMHLAYKEDKSRMKYIQQFIGKTPNDSFYKTRHCPVYCAEDNITYNSLAEMQKLGVATRALVVAMNKGNNYYNGKHYAFIADKKAMQAIQQYKNKSSKVIVEKKFKPVYCLELDKSFKSGTEVQEKLNISHGNLSRAVQNWDRLIGGYHWCYLKDKDKLINKFPTLKGCNKKQDNVKVKVMCIETGHIFNSAKEAADFYNIQSTHICRCCSGKEKTACGYHWRYLDEKE